MPEIPPELLALSLKEVEARLADENTPEEERRRLGRIRNQRIVRRSLEEEVRGQEEALRRAVIDALAEIEKQEQHAAEKRARCSDVEVQALAVFFRHPDWTVKRIAEEIGCSLRYLYNKSRHERFHAARAALQEERQKFRHGLRSDRRRNRRPI